MDLTCFLLIANICLPPTSTQVVVIDNNVGRYATATYATASVRISRSRDDISQYDWPNDSAIPSSKLNYWKYNNPNDGKIEYTIYSDDLSVNVNLYVDKEIEKSILDEIYILTRTQKIPLSSLSTARNTPTPRRMNALHP